VQRGEDEERGSRVEQGERLAVHGRHETRASGDPVAPRTPLQPPALARVPADGHELQGGVAPREPDEAREQQVEVLVPLGVADEEQEGPRDPEGPGDARRGLRVRERAEELLDTVRDDRELPARPREGRFDVACGSAGDRDHAGRGGDRTPDHQARVEPRQAPVLARLQVNEVVDRDNRGAGQARGQHVVRSVVEVEPQLARLRRERRQLAQRVAAGALGHEPHPLPGGEQPLVAGAVEENPLGRALEPHQPLDEVAHMRADAVVRRLAGVDADAHAHRRPPAASR
jgi:hypothetical protein